VQFANHLQETGTKKLQAVIEAAGTRLRPILMDDGGNGRRSLPAGARDRPGPARATASARCSSAEIIGTAVHAVRRASIYMLLARTRVPVTEQKAQRPASVRELAEAV